MIHNLQKQKKNTIRIMLPIEKAVKDLLAIELTHILISFFVTEQHHNRTINHCHIQNNYEKSHKNIK